MMDLVGTPMGYHILIAHRPETIAHVQRVVQVRRGTVVEGGLGA